MIIPTPPASIEETRLFEKIIQSPPKDGLLNLATYFIKAANPIADSIIGGPFNQYTLHNRDHIKKIFHIAGHIVSGITLQLLSPVECLIFLYSAYLHDLGMAITNEEFKGYIVDPAYLDSIEQWPQMKEAFTRARNQRKNANEAQQQLIEAEIADLQRAALASYLRPLHATPGRYKSLIKLIKENAGRSDIFEFNGQSLEPELVSICESHNLNSTVLGEIISAHEDRFPRAMPIGGYQVNIQFIAALLRLSDILDFDYERTPKTLFESLGIKHSNLPGAEVSLVEWEKHLSVHTIEILKEELVISGTCKHPIIESGIREFCQVIEQEIHDTLAVLRRNNTEILERYQIILPPIVRANIRSEGYLYMNLALKLDEAAIMSLLMGNRLYNSPLVAVRELIQNAVDASLVRVSLLGEPGYKPYISVTIEEHKTDKSHWLVVIDNGIGMDEYVLKHHFFSVGSSYYSSPEYKRLYRNSTALMPAITSKFGIGFLSTFMIGDEIEIVTRKKYPGGGNSRGKKVFIERMGALAFVQEDENIEIGTSVKVRITNQAIDSEAIENFIHSNIIRPLIPVELNLGRTREILSPRNYYTLKISEKSEVHKYNLKIIELNIDRATGIEGKVILVLSLTEEGQLSHRAGNQNIEITTSSPNAKSTKVNPSFLIQDFEGNRATVGGFKMSFSNLVKLFGTKRRRVSFIYDLDFTPNDEIEFNVSRTKILDEGFSLRKKIRNAIINELQSSKEYKLFDDDTKRLFKSRPEKDAFDFSNEQLKERLDKAIQNKLTKIEPHILDKVEAKLVQSSWPQNVHREIAQELGISRNQAYTAISFLIVSGRVKNPNQKGKISKSQEHEN
jgi:molecular chaperone HtpG